MFDPGLLLPLFDWNGTNLGAGLLMMNVQTSVVTSITEPLFGSYLAVTETNLYLTITNLPPASYDVYVYAHGEDAAQNSAVRVVAAWSDHGWLVTTNSENWGSLEWAEGVQYVVFRDVMVPSGQALAITISPDASSVALLNGIQFVVNDLATNRDTDGDGLTDLDELTRGTNPRAVSTLNDGIGDWVKVLQGRNPLKASVTAYQGLAPRLRVHTPLE